VRLIGDRSIQEKDFGQIQIDRIAEMQKWAENIKNVQEHMNQQQQFATEMLAISLFLFPGDH
jgi:hypothetical protein